ncbi:homoserine dehydrogenase [Alkalispirochaeta americana]|uniref:Homoserine dehydrogenase n=2 Tax=Alkalispirochaeta americana TaxID=159291 RepID=A0A1N6RC50_9SPIO|nr:homoserine dehydrogenase [Alkalispirochaeta americana]
MRPMSARKRIRAALVGCGTVGGATARILLQDKELLLRRSGVEVELVALVDKSFDHARSLGIPEDIFRSDLDEVLADPTLDVIIELAGGVEFPRTLISRALDAGKHVVTANKALLALHGRELFAKAREKGLTIGFEASCAGGIPVIRAITDGLLANEIDAIYGILNGTSNYILSEMIHKGSSYADSLDQAQQIGLAEADPSLDVQGGDTAHKIAIMSSLAFGISPEFTDIPVSGIDNLDEQDVLAGRDLGYVVKLLAVAHRTPLGVAMWVGPAFISREHPLAWVEGPFNAVSIYGHAVGHTLFYGRGAGGDPTASAVISDILGLALGITPALFGHTGFWPDRNGETRQLPAGSEELRFYLRIMAVDKPGVLAAISTILAREQISIASLHQNEQARGQELIPVVITTHTCTRQAMNRAVQEINALDITGAGAVLLPIVDEHPEKIS